MNGFLFLLLLHNCVGFPDYDMRGYKINVAMAEKSAPRQPANDHGYFH
jgi:RNA-binding protein FUS